jgi:predicted transposase YbfD/YdcC
MPDLEGGVITADALHLQVETIAQVVEDKNGHVLVGLKRIFEGIFKLIH